MEESQLQQYTMNEEVFTEELGWYSYKALVERVVELEAALDATLPTHRSTLINQRS